MWAFRIFSSWLLPVPVFLPVPVYFKNQSRVVLKVSLNTFIFLIRGANNRGSKVAGG
jgi:hypothetical protein